MKTYTTQEIEAFDFTVTYANAMFSGYGHNKIEVEADYNGERKSFKATTTRLDSVDEAKELEGQEKYEALYEIVEHQLDGVIAEWIYELSQYYIISYSFGDSTEYYNSSMVNDDFSTKDIDRAEGFKTKELAESVLEDDVRPFAESKGWTVSFSIEKY